MLRRLTQVAGLLLALAPGLAPMAWGESRLRADHLRCEYRVNPVGVDVRQPRLSWTLAAEGRGAAQSAYQVLVATSLRRLALDQGDLWDPGKVDSDDTAQIPYQGKPLASRQAVWWKVRTWNQAGHPGPWSTPASWTMGLLEPADWTAQWIGDEEQTALARTVATNAPGALSAALLRREFTLTRGVRRATAYATALGVYELRLNGHRVGDQLLAPEWTAYRQRVQYQIYDVTDLLRRGANALAASLGEGWYAGRLMAVGRFAYGRSPRLLVQLEVEFDDGSRETIATDGSWRTSNEGPIRSSGIYDGEDYDARREQPGWDQPGFAAIGWHEAIAAGFQGPLRVGQPNEPILVEQELAPVKLSQPRPGVFVFDLGQNLVGWCRVQADGVAGRTVTFRHAEMLNDDGTLYTANLRGAPQVDHYTPRADGAFTFEPHFTYHGFRFVELTGLASPPSRRAVVGRVFHSAAPRVGRFACSEPALNQLMQNILWTERANLMSSPNDCPQRDERFGWMGDIQAFAQTGIFNLDLAAFVTKFAQDIRDDQATDGRFPDFAPHPGDPNLHFSGVPAWGDAGVIVPWRAYQNYGDTRLLAEHFDAARRWVDYIHRLNPDHIWSKGRNNDYNDWLNGDWVRQADWPTQGGSVPPEVLATAFFAHSTELVARMAERVGRTNEAAYYAGLAAQIREAFRGRFVRADGLITGDTQAGYALALNFDLLPLDLRQSAVDRLVAGIHRYHEHLSTGIQTTHRAMLELARWDHPDLAWQLLTNRTFPSWRYMIDNGATTIWERWDGYVRGRGFQDAGMNSFNHWALGAVGEWVWRYAAGLNPDDAHPGWKHFTIRPQPGGGVTWVQAEYDSLRGRIRSRWRQLPGTFTVEVDIPPNTSATVVLPATPVDQVREGGRFAGKAEGVRLLKVTPGQAWFEVSSGHYRFTVTHPNRGRDARVEGGAKQEWAVD